MQQSRVKRIALISRLKEEIELGYSQTKLEVSFSYSKSFIEERFRRIYVKKF